MADVRKLKRFLIDEDDDVFRLRIEDEAGATFEVVASHEQIDVIADSLYALLDGEEDFIDDDEDDSDSEPKKA